MRAIPLLLVLPALAAAQERPGYRKMVEETKLSLADAIDLAVKEAGDGFPFHAELEFDKGAVVYSVDVAKGKETVNVVLDPKDGKVIEKETESDDRSTQVNLCKVTLKSAIETALRRWPGAAVEAQLMAVNDERGTLFVKVAVGDAVTRIAVNATTGEARIPQSLPGLAVRPFTDTFRVERTDLAPSGRNPYFVLEPGHVLVLEGDGGKLTITVLAETRVVDGVTTGVVEEREEKAGKLVEVSRNFFAISKRTNDVYYFGEEVDIYRDGKVASHEGAWLSGQDGARFGLMMPGTPLQGARYHQEIAPDVAMDRAEVVSMTRTCETPAGKFEGCLEVEESTPLEKGLESKFYAPDIGLLRDGKMRLTKHGKG